MRNDPAPLSIGPHRSGGCAQPRTCSRPASRSTTRPDASPAACIVLVVCRSRPLCCLGGWQTQGSKRPCLTPISTGLPIRLGQLLVEQGEVRMRDVRHAEVVRDSSRKNARLGESEIPQVGAGLGVEAAVGARQIDRAQVDSLATRSRYRPRETVVKVERSAGTRRPSSGRRRRTSNSRVFLWTRAESGCSIGVK